MLAGLTICGVNLPVPVDMYIASHCFAHRTVHVCLARESCVLVGGLPTLHCSCPLLTLVQSDDVLCKPYQDSLTLGRTSHTFIRQHFAACFVGARK